MKKLIFFSIFIFFDLIFSRTFLVPEEFLSIQQAVVIAQNEDTVSVNFGRLNGERSIVNSQWIKGNEITFEVRGEGEKELIELIRIIDNFPSTDKSVSQHIATGWQGQQRVCRPDTFQDVLPHISMATSGHHWVTWDVCDSFNGSKAYWFACTQWNGTGWDEESYITPWDSMTRLNNCLTLDDLDRPWVIWHNAPPGTHNSDIWFTRWNGTSWEPESQVNSFDSTELDFQPKIAIGGGEIWVVWYGGPTDVSPYTIYATRWNGHDWEPDMQVSPSDSNQDWMPSIAVDSTGNPHVVWCEYPHYRIYYSKFNGQQWTTPVIVNDTTRVRTASWVYPEIAIDCAENIHVAHQGREIGKPDLDIFYNKYDGQQWSSSLRINRYDSLDDWVCDIAADRPDNVWLAWTKIIASNSWEIHISHFDGTNWSEEERLDNDSAAVDNCPTIGLDRDGYPWVVWDGYNRTIAKADIYYNRYIASGIKFDNCQPNPIFTFGITPSPSSGKLTIALKVPRLDMVELKMFDSKGKHIQTIACEQLIGGEYTFNWNRRNESSKYVPNGVYFIQCQIGNRKKVKKVILLK
jgi:hypothetical protein